MARICTKAIRVLQRLIPACAEADAQEIAALHLSSGAKPQFSLGIQRLEAYDRNKDFNGVEDVGQEYHIKTPEGAMYRDINTDTLLPYFDMAQVIAYLRSLNKELTKDAKGLYAEGFLRSLRATSDLDSNQVFIRAWCRAQMKKSVEYEVDVVLDIHGVINECQCDCGAGMGPEAHCKHVCAVLCALVDFKVSGSLTLEESCTQKLQTFHQTKKFKGSPVKAQNLKLRSATSRNGAFDPRPYSYRSSPDFLSSFRNKCINFASTSSCRMPILQLFPPANQYAIANDHDFFKLPPQDEFLQHEGITHITEAQCQEVRDTTLGQASNKAWHTERCKRLQSSQFGRICKATGKTDMVRMAKLLTRVNQIRAKAIDHSIRNEPVALRKYAELTGTEVKPCGIIVSQTHHYLACSPDGIVSDDLIVEVKCPYSTRDKPATTVSVPYLVSENDQLTLNSQHDYYYQIQGQMFCTNSQRCHLVVFTSQSMEIVQIARDNDFITTMISKLKVFFRDYFKDAVLDSMFFHHFC